MTQVLLFSCGDLVVLKQLKDRLFGNHPEKLKVVCITTAANVYAEDARDWQKSEMDTFREFGFRLDTFDLLGKTPQQVQNYLADADVIYVTGGNTYYLLEQAQKSGFVEIAREHINQGKLYIGCSAGAVLACHAVDFIQNMDDPSKGNPSGFKAINALQYNLFPHADHYKYGPQVERIASSIDNGYPNILLGDNQALLIQGDKLEILEAPKA